MATKTDYGAKRGDQVIVSRTGRPVPVLAVRREGVVAGREKRFIPWERVLKVLAR